MLSLINKKIIDLADSLALKVDEPLTCNDRFEHVATNLMNGQVNTQLLVGENLTYLKGLVLDASKLIDVCYIDPPYNTGSKFLYRDSRKSSNHPLFGSHATWMEFMLPRLVLAKELLKPDGVIAISIDDYELAYLKFLMDRVFGEENFICNVIVCRSKNGKGGKKNVATNHEYLLIYGNSKNAKLNGDVDKGEYPKSDEYGCFRTDGLFRKKGDASLRTDRPNMYYPLYFDASTGKVSTEPVDGWGVVYPKDSKGVERRWLWGRETAKDREWQLFASSKGVIYVKNYASEKGESKRIKIRTIWSESPFYTERATNELKDTFGSKVFDTPKPVEYIKKVIDVCGDSEAIVLDFFAGSATTAQAVYELNNSDGGNRKCLLMEIDAPIPIDHAAHKAGFNTIADIAKARLHKIKEHDLDFYFSCTYINEIVESTSVN